MSASERRFEFCSESVTDFWSVAVSGACTTVRQGKDGTCDLDTEETTDHGDESAANAFAEQQIASKMKEGYIEVTGESSGAKAQVLKTLLENLERRMQAAHAEAASIAAQKATDCVVWELATGPADPADITASKVCLQVF
jgi:predicted DNA-binding WGR domain protein